MKRILLALVISLVVGASVHAVEAPVLPDYERALAAIFVFGDTGGWMGCGFVVGDGGLVLTTADLVTDSFGPKSKVTIKYPFVLSKYTGDAYRAEVVFVDRKTNLALLKLPIKGLPAVPLADADKLQKPPYPTLGQLLSGDMVGSRWDTRIYALGREIDAAKSSSKLAVKKWTAHGAALVETRGVRWLFLSRIDPDTNPPRAALVWRDDAGVVGIYNSKFIVEGGKKPANYGQCLPSSEILKQLAGAKLDLAGLTKVSEPTVKPDQSAKPALQAIWASMTELILGKWPGAEHDARALTEMRKDSALAHLLLGVALAGGGKRDEAIKSLDKAISIDTTAPGAYLTRAESYAFSGKSKEAEADFKKAVEQAPADFRPLVAMAGFLAVDKNRLDEAVELAKKAVALEPEHPGVRMAFGLILKQQHNYDQAIAELKTALDLSPDLGPARAALAATYESSGDLTSAEADFRELIKAEPKNPAALFALASFLADHDKKDEAKKLIAQILEMKPPKELETAAKELQKKL
jgi:tetratricopeptide (TPR) repeat protein